VSAANRKVRYLDWSEGAAWKAIREGNGSALLKNLKRASNLPAALLHAGQLADLVRRDIRHGRALLFCADFILEHRVKDIYRALPTIAIAASRAHHGKGEAARAHAAAVLAKLAPIVAVAPALVVEQIAVVALELHEDGKRARSRDLYVVVRGNHKHAKHPALKELAKRHAR